MQTWAGAQLAVCRCAGPGGLLRVAGGLSYAAIAAGAVVLAIQARPPICEVGKVQGWVLVHCCWPF